MLRLGVSSVTEVAIIIAIAALAAVAGVALGIVLIAPRITRVLDREQHDDEEARDRPH